MGVLTLLKNMETLFANLSITPDRENSELILRNKKSGITNYPAKDRADAIDGADAEVSPTCFGIFTKLTRRSRAKWKELILEQ